MTTPSSNRTPILAVFCDFENVALGVRDAKFDQFDIRKVLERLLLKGPIVVKKAYCDWERYKKFKPAMHEAAFEMIEIPHLRQSGKNSADIRLVVDALDLCYTKGHVNTFVIISGDSDFSPLVSKLRENNKEVIGVGVASSTSDLLIANCDEFIYYDDLVRQDAPKKAVRRRSVKAKAGEEAASDPTLVNPATATDGTAEEPKRKPRSRGGRRRGGKATEAVAGVPTEGNTSESQAAFALLHNDDDDDADGNTDPNGNGVPDANSDRATRGLRLIMDTIAALVDDRGEEQKIWGSMVKQTLRRRSPGFNERFHGFRSFNAMLEEAAERGWLSLEKDSKSGGYILRPLESGEALAHADDVEDTDEHDDDGQDGHDGPGDRDDHDEHDDDDDQQPLY